MAAGHSFQEEPFFPRGFKLPRLETVGFGETRLARQMAGESRYILDLLKNSY